MKPMISSLSALSAMMVLTAPAASALTCAEQAADLQNRQIKAQEIADARLALVDEVEAAGDAWEDVEVHRLASSGHAQVADDAKQKYDTLKADLMQKEMALQTMLVSLNDEVEVYNSKCVKN